MTQIINDDFGEKLSADEICPQCYQAWNKLMADGLCWDCSPLKDLPKEKRPTAAKKTKEGTDQRSRAAGGHLEERDAM